MISGVTTGVVGDSRFDLVRSMEFRLIRFGEIVVSTGDAGCIKLQLYLVLTATGVFGEICKCVSRGNVILRSIPRCICFDSLPG